MKKRLNKILRKKRLNKILRSKNSKGEKQRFAVTACKPNCQILQQFLDIPGTDNTQDDPLEQDPCPSPESNRPLLRIKELNTLRLCNRALAGILLVFHRFSPECANNVQLPPC